MRKIKRSMLMFIVGAMCATGYAQAQAATCYFKMTNKRDASLVLTNSDTAYRTTTNIASGYELKSDSDKLITIKGEKDGYAIFTLADKNNEKHVIKILVYLPECVTSVTHTTMPFNYYNYGQAETEVVIQPQLS